MWVGVGVEVTVGWSVAVGVIVGGIGVFVGRGVDVGGTGVEAGAHPLTRTVSNTTERKINPMDFFILSSPFDLITHTCP